MLTLPHALAPLAQYKQFTVCRLSPDPARPGKTLKVPLSIWDGIPHDVHDPAIWIDAQMACNVVDAWNTASATRTMWYCVAFSFTEADPFYFIDVDDCATDDGWSPIVDELFAALPGACIEISQSGRGLHFIGVGSTTIPSDERKKKDHTNQLFDLYTQERYVALTGNVIAGDARIDQSAGLDLLVEKHLRKTSTVGGVDGWTDGPREGWNGPVDDGALLQRMMRSVSGRSTFGVAASFADLWDCNVDVLAVSYPPDPNGQLPYDGNRVDAALAQHLAFWTGCDCERMQRLMFQSQLVRAKWEDRDDYITRTILVAVGMQTEYLTDKTPEPLATMSAVSTGAALATMAPEFKLVEGSTYLDPDQQVTLFVGCVYVCDQHRVLVPGGALLKPEQFKVMYGGYQLKMDRDNTKTTRDAWEAFTQSVAFRAPRAEGTCFRPDEPPAALIDYGGQAKVNTYHPVAIRRVVGDATLFNQHMALLLPNEQDRLTVLYYMAACVQLRGRKFKWAVVLQGVEGNGKTLLSQCVEYAVGQRYTFWPRADQLGEKFNSWLFSNIFIGVEDAFVPEHQAEIIEILKPMITGENLTRRAMQTDGVRAETCANFMLNMNSKGGLRKSRNDRRLWINFTPQQEHEDLVKYGMDMAYFTRLFTWLRGDGFAIVAELLHTQPIPPEFINTLMSRAPLSSSHDEVMAHGMGLIEQEVQDAIEMESPGFRGGWISSIWFDRMLERLGGGRSRLSFTKRRELLQTLGYDWHPGLSLGRTNNDVMPDAGKPRLYIKRNHPARGLTGAANIARAYTEAQVAEQEVLP